MVEFSDERDMKINLFCPACYKVPPGCDRLREGMLMRCPNCGVLMLLVKDEDSNTLEFQLGNAEL